MPVDAIASLNVTDPALGLSDAEAAARMAILRDSADTLSPPAWRLAVRRVHGIIIALLAIIFVTTAVLRLWVECAVVLALLLLNAGCAALQKRRSKRGHAALRKLRERPARALRNGRLTTLPASELVPGDVIVVETGDVVPADGRLFATESLSCRETPLTERPAPARKSVEAVPTAAPLSMRNDMIYMGTQIESGCGRAIVVATGTDAAISMLAGPEVARSR